MYLSRKAIDNGNCVTSLQYNRCLSLNFGRLNLSKVGVYLTPPPDTPMPYSMYVSFSVTGKHEHEGSVYPEMQTLTVTTRAAFTQRCKPWQWHMWPYKSTTWMSTYQWRQCRNLQWYQISWRLNLRPPPHIHPEGKQVNTSHMTTTLVTWQIHQSCDNHTTCSHKTFDSIHQTYKHQMRSTHIQTRPFWTRSSIGQVYSCVINNPLLAVTTISRSTAQRTFLVTTAFTVCHVIIFTERNTL